MRHLPVLGCWLALLYSAFPAAAAERKAPPKTLEYLLDGVTSLYVVDESRCSAQPNSPDAGKWYVIEQEQYLQRLRAALAKVDRLEESACGCGGPDIHFYGESALGELSYFGLDCESALDGYEIPKSLQDLIIPSRRGFLGKVGGPAYIVDVPLEIPEPDIRARFAKSDLYLLVGGWWNVFNGSLPREYAQRLHLERTAPVYLELKVGPIRAPKWATKDPEAGEDAMRHVADERVRKWLDAAALTSLLIMPEEVSESVSSGDEATFEAECYLRDAGAVRRILSRKKELEKPGLWISEVKYRSEKERSAPGFYQAALLLPESGVAEGLRRAKKALPGGGKITALCDCRPAGS